MTIGQRFENSRVGRALLSVAMIVVIVSVLAWNLPAGRPHDQASQATSPIVQALGLEQDWALFAPDPRTAGLALSAEVTFRDGHTTRWAPPHNGVFVTPYRNYRWQKYVERVVDDSYSGLWAPTAEWIARRYGDGVTKVALIRTVHPGVFPGDGTARPPAKSTTFYTLYV